MDSKRLYILRHAEADGAAHAADRDRPLTQAGKRDAEALARRMQQDNYRPDHILCSSARRTRETGDAVLAVWPEITVDYRDGLYLASTGALFEVAKSMDNSWNAAMLIGHNPGIHGFVRLLGGTGAPDLLSRIAGSYPAGGLAVLDCNCASWKELMPGAARLADLLVGKELA